MQTTIKTAKPTPRLMFGDRELTPQEASRLLRLYHCRIGSGNLP